MRKVQNVINYFFIAMGVFGFSQIHLEGVYSPLGSFQDHYETYSFLHDNRFEYHKGASLGDDEYGIGEFSVKNDSLVLTFTTPPIEMSSHRAFVWKNDGKDSKIKLIVKNRDGNSISGANVLIKELESFELIDAKIANSEGVTQFNFEKKYAYIWVEVSYIEYKVYRFILNKNNSTNVEVYLQNQGDGVPITQTSKKYLIVDSTKTHLFLRNEKGERIEWRRIE